MPSTLIYKVTVEIFSTNSAEIADKHTRERCYNFIKENGEDSIYSSEFKKIIGNNVLSWY